MLRPAFPSDIAPCSVDSASQPRRGCSCIAPGRIHPEAFAPAAPAALARSHVLPASRRSLPDLCSGASFSGWLPLVTLTPTATPPPAPAGRTPCREPPPPVYRPPSSSGEEGEGARGSSEGTKRSPQRGAEGLNSGRTGFEYRFCHLPPCQPRPPLTPTWFLRSSPPNPARGGTNVHPASLLGGARGACRCPSWCLACHSLLTKWKLP